MRRWIIGALVLAALAMAAPALAVDDEGPRACKEAALTFIVAGHPPVAINVGTRGQVVSADAHSTWNFHVIWSEGLDPAGRKVVDVSDISRNYTHLRACTTVNVSTDPE